MKIWDKVKNIATGTIKETGQQVSKVIDESTTSLEERQQAMNERLKIDNESLPNSFVRPFIVLWLTTILTLSGYDVLKPEEWLQKTVSEAFQMVIIFYFAERGIRYLIKQIKSKK